ncbi:general substrate transporter [Aspergillus desertorum]
MRRPDDKNPIVVGSHGRTWSLPSSQQQPNQSVLQSARKSGKTVAWCFILASGMVLYGYDLAIVGSVSSMPEFQKDFGRRLDGKLIIPALWLALWNIANPVGGVLGALAGGYVQDCAGRRRSLTIASIVSAVGVAVAYVSDLPRQINSRRSVILVAKLVQGFAVNQVMCTTQTYMSEVLPPVLRGPVLGLFPTFILVGQLIGSIFIYAMAARPGSEGYKLCFVSEWPFSVLPFVASFLMPESPTYLMRKNRLDEARKCQERLSSSPEEADAVLKQARLSIELEKKGKDSVPGYLDCFKSTNRRRTMLVLFACLLPQLFGMSLLAKGSYFMQVVGMNAHTSLVFLQVGVGLGLVANVGSMITIANFGRRPLTLFGLIACIILWMGMGIAGCFSGTVTIWYTQITILLVVTLTGLTVWPASYAFGAEASSLQLRAKTQGLGWLVNCLSNGILGIALPYIFNDDEGALGAKTGFVYMGFCILSLAVAWRIVPEMKDKTAMEIDWIFEGNNRQSSADGEGHEVEAGENREKAWECGIERPCVAQYDIW